MKWYKKAWFTWLMLVFIPPVGIFLLWKYRTFSIKAKSILSIIFLVWFISVGSTGSDKNNNNTQTSTPATQEVRLSNEAKDIQKETKLTNEQSENVANILKQCGFDEFKIKYDSTLDNIGNKGEKGYILTYKDMPSKPEILMSITPDGNVYQIIYAGSYLYNNGAVQSKIQDYYVDTNETVKIMSQASLIIDKCLKAPSTAEYADVPYWNIRKTPDNIRVSSYVDAENSFGAHIRSDFTVVFSSDLQTVKSVTIDVKEYLTK